MREVKEQDDELIRFEKHAGLYTLLMSTTKDWRCFSSGVVRDVTCYTDDSYFNTHTCRYMCRPVRGCKG